jgi:glycosyltransferase involved in cell wall biosynthesis
MVFGCRDDRFAGQPEISDLGFRAWDVTRKNSATVRVAFLAGTLGRGGAEKQLLYMTRALLGAGVAVKVLSLTRAETYEAELQASGIQPEWVGRWPDPPRRLYAITRALAGFRPHILQAGHFFTNLYVTLVSPLYRAAAVGSIRSDVSHDVAANGGWGPWLLRSPPSLVANSWAAKHNAEELGVSPDRLHVLPNVIDLAEFDRLQRRAEVEVATDGCRVMAIGSLVPWKRFDRLLNAVALLKAERPELRTIVVGDGPERSSLEGLAHQLGLLPSHICFLGKRSDVPGLLRGADILVSSSDHEGFPNVLLEAMAAGLPVVTTPAGDAARVVEDTTTGFVTPFDDPAEMAQRIGALASSAPLRRRMGDAGRQRVEQYYAFDTLAGRLVSLYARIAAEQGNHRLQSALNRMAIPPVTPWVHEALGWHQHPRGS